MVLDWFPILAALKGFAKPQSGWGCLAKCCSTSLARPMGWLPQWVAGRGQGHHVEAFGVRTSASFSGSVVILLQVHLQQPCYDFCYL